MNGLSCSKCITTFMDCDTELEGRVCGCVGGGGFACVCVSALVCVWFKNRCGLDGWSGTGQGVCLIRVPVVGCQVGGGGVCVCVCVWGGGGDLRPSGVLPGRCV
ncbi:unnamed protein product [Arctogadus glacialis]